MPEIPAIEPIHQPPMLSVIIFCAIVAYVVGCFAFGLWRTDPSRAKGSENGTGMISLAIPGLVIWLTIGAALPLSGILSIPMLPPPGLLFAIFCFIAGLTFASSRFGERLATLPIAWLVGFHVFRLPLELILHYWYSVGTIPIQMTYVGHNFDIVTGVLALIVGIWALLGSPPRFVIWGFNVIGFGLLMTVVLIAMMSAPGPTQSYVTVPDLLLPFYFPFSYIVSIAVTGALVGHVVLYRKLKFGLDEVPAPKGRNVLR